MRTLALVCGLAAVSCTALADSKHRHNSRWGSGPVLVGSGKRQVDLRTGPSIHSLSVGAGFAVRVVAGPPSVKLSWDDNLLTLVKLKNEQGVLRVEVHSANAGGFVTELRPELEISTPEAIRSIDFSGGVSGVLARSTAAQVALTLSGGAELEATSLKVTQLTIDLSGGAEAKLSGQVESATVEVSGGAELKAGGLTVGRASVELSGGAEASLRVTEDVKGSVSGAASLKLSGKPKAVSISRSGSGECVYENGTRCDGRDDDDD
jgi:Putative auto-transporter adhesin, head GIN domain